jgi:CHAT domain-containing protein
MNFDRKQAYLNLIDRLLTCPSDEEAEVLKSHPELLDGGLVAAMLEEADRLREQGKLNKANWLKNFAGLLGKVEGDFLAVIPQKAEAERLFDRGNQQYRISQFREALQSWEEALTIYREIGDRQGEADSLGNLGLAYYSLGQYHRAIEFYEQSLVIDLETGYRQGKAASLGNLGLAYDSLGQYNRAIEFHKQLLEIAREIRCRSAESDSLCNLSLAYYSLGEYKQAIEFQKQSLVIERAIKNRSGEAASLCNLGLAYYSLGQYHKAIDFYEQSLVISREIKQRQWQANSLSNLGITYYEISNIIRIFYQKIPKFLVFFVKKYFIKFELDCLQEAESKLCESIQIREAVRSELVKDDHKISFFETQVLVYQNLQKVLVAQSKFDEALETSEMGRTRAFVELLRQTLLTNDVPANDETHRLSIPKIQQIARDRNSTIVEYSIVDPEIYIWVIQPNGNITHRAANLEPLNQQNQSLKQIVLKARVSIGTTETDGEGNKIQLESEYKRDETGRFPLLQLLYQILIEPIADLLPADVNSPIIFIPHYDLFLVPFAALQSGNNRYLIEDYTILTSPSIQVLELTREHHDRVRGLREAALIVGDPTIHPNYQKDPYKLRQIPRAKEAAEAIAAILQTQAISGENAAKAIILDQMLNTRIVHLSAHGLLDDFGGSGIPGAIILASSGDTDDGAIHAADILQLKLNSELVVLSACSTGRGKITGDGVIGLSRCFILAGVPSIIVSLWNMGVISAKLLMTEFYQNLARGDNRAAALRRAMLTTKERFPSPIAWAAFTLIGETESLSLQIQQVDLRRLIMSLPDNYTPTEIVAGLTKLLQISEPKLFANDLPALDVQTTDNVNIIAEKIKAWCETRRAIEENLENEIEQCGPGGTDGDAPDEIVSEFMEVLQENLIRLNLSPPSSLSVETEDNSGTESVDNPT